MSSTNLKSVPTQVTHEGAPAKRITTEQEFRRTVMACMLWEDQFYEDGQSIADRIAEHVASLPAEVSVAIAHEARNEMNLRHVPLLIARELLRDSKKRPQCVRYLLAEIIQRPDELTEFVSLFWKDGRKMLPYQARRGLATAFTKFDRYQLAKYNRKGMTVKLRDVLFLCHAKPKNGEQAQAWKDLINDRLDSPDTWEFALATGQDKRTTFERLIAEGLLGPLALLRNLRNMTQANVPDGLIRGALQAMNVDRILPFRFIAAARHAPQFEPELEAAMFKSCESMKKLPGTTLLLVDVSGSMGVTLSQRSEMTRMDAACGVAMLLREITERVVVYTFSMRVVTTPPRRGFALRDAIVGSQLHSGTYLGAAVDATHGIPHDRLVVITDEQAHDQVGPPPGRGHLINIASSKNGVGYGKWHHIDGWSDSVVRYLSEVESELA